MDVLIVLVCLFPIPGNTLEQFAASDILDVLLSLIICDFVNIRLSDVTIDLFVGPRWTFFLLWYCEETCALIGGSIFVLRNTFFEFSMDLSSLRLCLVCEVLINVSRLFNDELLFIITLLVLLLAISNIEASIILLVFVILLSFL